MAGEALRPQSNAELNQAVAAGREAGGLRDSPIFQAALRRIEKKHYDTFVTSAPADSAKREQAHVAITALREIVHELNMIMAEGLHAESKLAHRAADTEETPNDAK